MRTHFHLELTMISILANSESALNVEEH